MRKCLAWAERSSTLPGKRRLPSACRFFFVTSKLLLAEADDAVNSPAAIAVSKPRAHANHTQPAHTNPQVRGTKNSE